MLSCLLFQSTVHLTISPTLNGEDSVDSSTKWWASAPFRWTSSTGLSFIDPKSQGFDELQTINYKFLFVFNVNIHYTCPPPSGNKIVSSKTTLNPSIVASFPSAFFWVIAAGSQSTTFDSNLKPNHFYWAKFFIYYFIWNRLFTSFKKLSAWHLNTILTT